MKLTIEKNEDSLKILIEDAHGQRPYLDVTYDDNEDLFKITEHEIGEEREMGLYSALAYAVTIAGRYDYFGSYHAQSGHTFAHEMNDEPEEEDDEECECHAETECDCNDANDVSMIPISVMYLVFLDENAYDDRAYFELRPYIVEAIRNRAMTRFTDMNQCFCPYVTKIKERKDPNLN